MRVLLAAVLLFLVFPVARAEDESPLVAAGAVAFEPVAEMSGIAKSNTFDDVYWVMNDSGDIARIFALDGKGEVIQPGFWDEKEPYPGIELLPAANLDWEDITIDGDTLYVADVGNNGNARRDLGVYVVREPNPRMVTRLRPLAYLPIRYPEQVEFPGNLWQFDCEAVFASEGKLYFVTKHRVPGVFNSGEWGGRLYRLDTRYTDKENILTLVDSRPDLALATGAEVSPDGTKLALLTEFSLHILEKPEEGDRWLSGEERIFPLDRDRTKQAEAVCWDDDETIRITNEQREIYTIRLEAFGKAPAGPVITELGTTNLPRERRRDDSPDDPRPGRDRPPSGTLLLREMAFSPQGGHLVISHQLDDGHHLILNSGFFLIPTKNPQLSREITVPQENCGLPAFSRNGRFAAFCSAHGNGDITVRVIDLNTFADQNAVIADPRGQGPARLHAVSDDGTTLAVSERALRENRSKLLIWSMTKKKLLATLPDYQSPRWSDRIPGVVLAGDLAIYRSPTAGAADRPDYDLVAYDLKTGRHVRSVPGRESRHTPGHVVSRNARWLMTGLFSREVTRVRLDGGKDELLFRGPPGLASRQLELSMSPNEWMLTAWSDEREVLSCYDTVKREHFDLPIGLGRGWELLGLSTHGRYAYVTGGPGKTRVVSVLDLWRRVPCADLLEVPDARLALDPTGRFLATLTRDDENWNVKIHRLR